MLLRKPVSLVHPFLTTDPASNLISALKSILDVTFPWVCEVSPTMISPTLNSESVDTFNNSILLFQFSTLPEILPEVTFSPFKKLLVFKEISNWGKYFWGTIIPAEFSTSKFPGKILSSIYPSKL